MELSQFTFRIILLFIPGFLAFIVANVLTNHREFRLHQVLLYSLLLGFVCHAVYYVISLVNVFGLGFSFLKSLVDSSEPLDFVELILTTMLSPLVGLLVGYFINYKVLFRIAAAIRATRRHGDVDTWSFMMNSSEKGIEWVVVRDIENDLAYEGWVQAFSDSTEKDELVLRDVIVFVNSTGEELYETPALYLPRVRADVTIEFPKLPFGKNIERPLKEVHDGRSQ